MAEYALNYGVAPSEFWNLTRAQKAAFTTVAADINRRMKR